MQIIRNLLFCSEITVLLGAESNPCGAGAQSTIRCSTAEPPVFGARVAQQAAGTTFQIPFPKKWWFQAEGIVHMDRLHQHDVSLVRYCIILWRCIKYCLQLLWFVMLRSENWSKCLGWARCTFVCCTVRSNVPELEMWTHTHTHTHTRTHTHQRTRTRTHAVGAVISQTSVSCLRKKIG